MRKYGKIDLNQKSIVKQLRAIPGVSVLSIASMGNGCPDIIIGYKSRNYLIELKTTDKAKLTKDEEKFFNTWTGNLSLCVTFENVCNVIGVKI